jgi:hypothetical protein
VLLAALYGLALLPAAFFFGIAVYLWMAPCYDKVPGRAFAEWFQAIDPYMRVGAKWTQLIQLAFTLPLLALTAGWPFGLVCGSLGLSLGMLVLAVRGNMPLNRQMRTWNPTDLPAGWERVRDRWLRVHDWRGVAAAGAFTLLLAAALIDTPSRPAEPTAATHVEATVYLPLADNAGRSFPDATWDHALAGLVRPFGGATLGEPQEGCWVDDGGRLVRERVRPVVISFRPDELDRLRGAVRQLRRELAQEAVYVRLGDTRVELVR